MHVVRQPEPQQQTAIVAPPTVVKSGETTVERAEKRTVGTVTDPELDDSEHSQVNIFINRYRSVLEYI